ncbi:MAG: MFS transporter, partial [Agromyces sp.]
AALFGVVSAFDTPARQAFVNDLVATEHVTNAVALNAASFNAARLIGPAIAGGLLAVTSSGWVFLINAVTFIAVIVALLALRSGSLRTLDGPRAHVSMTEGFRYVKTRSDILMVLALVFLIGAFSMNFAIFSSTMSVVFGRGPETYGLLSSVLAVGSLAGALLSARRARARLSVVVIAAAGVGLASAGMALAPTVEVYGAIGALMGFSVVTMLTTANGYLQSTTEPRLRGRVIAIYLALMVGATPIGAPIVGIVADAAGPRWALAVSAAACALAVGIGVSWFSVARGLRLRRHPTQRWRVQLSQFAGIGQPLPNPASPLSVLTDNVPEPPFAPEKPLEPRNPHDS